MGKAGIILKFSFKMSKGKRFKKKTMVKTSLQKDFFLYGSQILGVFVGKVFE